jgi:hypothetical protein
MFTKVLHVMKSTRRRYSVQCSSLITMKYHSPT